MDERMFRRRIFHDGRAIAAMSTMTGEGRKTAPAAGCPEAGSAKRTLSGGFTLMEVLVAVTIVGMTVAVFFQLLSGSMKLEHRGQEVIRKRLLADRVFGDLQCRDIREADFPWNGETDGMSWRLLIYPVEVVDHEIERGEIPLQLPLELFRYEFRYAWKDRGERSISRHATYPPDFFDERFRSKFLAAPQD